MTGGETERSPVGCNSAYVTPSAEGKSEQSMADLLVREQAAEKNVHNLLKSQDEPLLNILGSLQEYRLLSQQVTFSDFEHGADKSSARLWLAHTETRKLLHRTLSHLRKAKDQPLAARQMTKVYLQFIKDSQRFYRNYIFQLNKTYGGIPELEAVAHKVKHDEVDESLPQSVAPGLRVKVLEQCHQALIYLGDISRYRTSDKLDKKPDFGPAIGYYGLACSLIPASGMGHHQQAVVALEQKHHLRAIYHLYRAIVVDRPHPNAQGNLGLEFDKINAAWDRGELIEKGPPNDPEGPHRSLVGWFVRLHSMCVKGESFRGQEELEREVMSQLTAEVKRRPLNNTLLRMLLVNFAAQHCARQNLQKNPTDKYVLAYYNFLRFNLRIFTSLLNLFQQELASVDVSASDDDELDLKARLTEISRRLLPSLRLYSIWLLPVAHIIHGLSQDAFLQADIQQFWRAYASAIDAVILTFPIWDLEELAEANYMLEEDVETLGFKPLLDVQSKAIWYDKQTGDLKPRFFDRDVSPLLTDEEMLVRIKAFLEDGLFLANDDKDAPIVLRGSRVVLKGTEEDELALPMAPETLPTHQAQEVAKTVTIQSQPNPAAPAPKALTYASAAANGHAQKPKPAAKTNPAPQRSRQAELSRMVDDLVDDDDDSAANNSAVPVTPPQQAAATPVVVANGDMTYNTVPPAPKDYAKILSYQPPQKQTAKRPQSSSGNSPAFRTPDRRQSSPRVMQPHSISRLWNPMPGQQQQYQQGPASPNWRPDLSTGGGGGGGGGSMTPRGGHSRVNSSTSIRSATTSPNPNTATAAQAPIGSMPGPWSSLPVQQTPVGGAAAAAPLSGLGQVPHHQAKTAGNGPVSSGYTALTSSSSAAGGAGAGNSPLLFGAGGSVWSSNGGALAGSVFSNSNPTPPNGQGG